MDVPPTRRRQHRQPLSRSASEPASKLSVSAGGPGAGRNAHQLSASLPASFAQNNNDHHRLLADSLDAEEEVKEHLLGHFPRCRSLHRNVGTCRMSVLSSLIAAAAMILWLGGTSAVVFIAVSTTHVHVHESNSDDGDEGGTIPTSRRVSIHNITKPLNLETDEETDARILEEDRRNDHHQRRKRLFANPVQRDKMIEELKKVKALLEKQQTSQSPLRGQRKNTRENTVT